MSIINSKVILLGKNVMKKVVCLSVNITLNVMV